jgi:trehalose 6-phosphate phosphatase
MKPSCSDPAWPELPPPSRVAFLLDFDGTLVDIAPAPDQVVVPADLPGHLRRLRLLCGDAVAIVSGRPMAQIEALLGDAPFALSGEHGTEFRHAPGAVIETLPIPSAPAAWLREAGELVLRHQGVRLEQKRLGFVLHYRAAPQARAAIQTALQTLLAGEPDTPYRILPAKMAWEVRPAGADKATAVRALMARPPFAGRLPVFIGDDVTDEDGMREARAMGGVGLRVDEQFGDPAGVRAWIAHLAGTKPASAGSGDAWQS